MTTTEHTTECQAVILDLDGVLTRTAALHREAWKAAFDQFLERDHPEQRHFDATRDYDQHVDGKPRLDGVRDFLASRGLEAPEGSPGDTLDDHTIRGIGNDKNRRFHELLEQRGAEVFEDALAAVRAWNEQHVPVAVVSSSRNCRPILESVGLAHMFDARVDGVTLGELGIDGKPAPDMYLEAARRLGVRPAQCAVVEDAIAGVEAARAGGFALVAGVDRSGRRADELRAHGADVVVSALTSLTLSAHAPREAAPPLFEHLDEIRGRLKVRSPALFLDFDGTLAPIVAHPEDATIDEAVRARLRDAAKRGPVAVVSGRDLEDVQARVAVEGLVYAGSHGFDIRGPRGLAIQHDAGQRALPALDAAEKELRETLAEIPGTQIERKRFAIAVHFRNANEDDEPRIASAVDTARRAHAGLRRTRGKKVFELRPDADWDKGRAVRWLINTLGLEASRTLPIYIGDDVTDEDAFGTLRGDGLGVLVAEQARDTAAHYRVRDVAEVSQFIDWLAEQTRRNGGKP